MTKILVIGLDAATMNLIEPWSAAGHLPALARLMAEGASARLLSTPNMHSASAWTAILTGLNPGRHGLFVFSDRDYATGKQAFFKGGDRRGEIISAHLARQGWTAGFLNVPMTYPAAAEAGGYMVSGLDAPALNEQAFSPAALRAEIFARFPDYHFAPPDLGELMKAGRLNDAVRRWLSLIEVQTAVAEHLITSRPTDFFMTVYTASDWGGHNLWNQREASTSGDVTLSLLAIYRALDQAIARLLRFADEQTQIYVLSDHGMGAHTGASYHLAAWLERRGYLVRNKVKPARASLIETGKRAAKRVLPESVKERVKAALGDERVKQLQAADKDTFYSSIDWSQTIAYSEPGRHVINLNLAGRNRDGIVSGADYAATCDRLIADLRQWMDEEGTPFVERVVRREEVYHGAFAERASDLHIYWNPAARVAEPPAEVKARGYWWSGDHRPEGILIAKGRGLRSGVQVAMPTVYDLVPTILHAAGLGVPADLDGRVIQEICTDDIRQAAVKLDSSASAANSQPDKLSADEEALIEEKLRALGYL